MYRPRDVPVKILTDGGQGLRCARLEHEHRRRLSAPCEDGCAVCPAGAAPLRAAQTNSTHNPPYNVWMYPYNAPARAWCSATTPGQRTGYLPARDRHAAQGLRLSGHERDQQLRRARINALGEPLHQTVRPHVGENGVHNNQIQGTFQEQLRGSSPAFSIWICGMWTEP